MVRYFKSNETDTILISSSSCDWTSIATTFLMLELAEAFDQETLLLLKICLINSFLASRTALGGVCWPSEELKEAISATLPLMADWRAAHCESLGPTSELSSIVSLAFDFIRDLSSS